MTTNTEELYDLSDVPTAQLWSEIANRRKPRAYKPKAKCDCGKCQTCKSRARVQAYRARQAQGN